MSMQTNTSNIVSSEKDQPDQHLDKSSKAKDKKKSFKIDIFKAWCKGCGICVAFCPTQVLKLNLDGESEVVNQDACVGCGWCEIRCPDFAISVKPAEENHHGP